ncbi:MAG: trypsin-like peptidase domain-containing protein [Chloroflexota bacterium]
MSKQAFKGIRGRIENGETKLALDELAELINDWPTDFINEVSLYISRFNRLYRDYRQGMITREEYNIDLSRLHNSILLFVDELTDKTGDYSSVNISTSSNITLPDSTAFEKVIGVDNLKQINWLRKGIELSSSVCRILTPLGKGTGFIVGPGLLMTNNHIIPNKEIASQSVAEFNYELDVLGSELKSYRYRLAPNTFYTSDQYQLDCTMVNLIANPELPPLEQWGMLKLNASAILFPGEHVTIIQHPQGGFKKIAITANQIVSQESKYLHYTTDTMKGSSGSPVFNDAWEVIAIHHAYGGVHTDSNGNQRHVNEGIMMQAIKQDMGALWPSV